MTVVWIWLLVEAVAAIALAAIAAYWARHNLQENEPSNTETSSLDT